MLNDTKTRNLTSILKSRLKFVKMEIGELKFEKVTNFQMILAILGNKSIFDLFKYLQAVLWIGLCYCEGNWKYGSI